MTGARAESGNTAKNRNKGRDVEKKERTTRERERATTGYAPPELPPFFLYLSNQG